MKVKDGEIQAFNGEPVMSPANNEIYETVKWPIQRLFTFRIFHEVIFQVVHEEKLIYFTYKFNVVNIIERSIFSGNSALLLSDL